MPPNNTNSRKSDEAVEVRLALEDRRPSKCHSEEETSLGKFQPNGIGHSKSQTDVKPRPGDGPQRNRSVCSLMDELLGDIYSKMEVKGRTSATTCELSWQDSDYSRCSRTELRCSSYWKSKDVDSLKAEKARLERLISQEGNNLVKQLKRKNFLLLRREAHYDVITAYIQAFSMKTREDTKMKFSLSPGAETGFSQWLDAMKMVAQLPGGMPSEFRTKLWLQLSEKHLNDQNVDWEKAEAVIFNEWTNPDDEELGVQIVKDLHRTGCSLFCGEQEHNQALLKRVLLAYARWNKNVGYCQGFNMLAALILQVMDKDERNAVKVMIYLIEGVLPESYFANNLRGLSVDMAVFRDLLRLRLPKLSKHLEALQHDTNAGTSYEPPLTNVFTMQWFLTLFSNCLPQQTVLRVWDLVFLYGNEVLLRTALAIWGILQDRVITVESADEFYSIMGVVTREMLEFGLMDANALVKMIAMVDPFPNELQELREKYLYNISPWTQSVHSAAKKGIRLFYSDPDDQDDTEDEDKIALATAYGVFRRRESASKELQLSGPTLDISVLKQQYAKLRQRQRQAHVIITAACSSNLTGNLTGGPSVSVNHLLMGKSALINKGRRIGPPEGSIPPPNNKKDEEREERRPKVVISGETFHWKDAEKRKLSKPSNKSRSNKQLIREKDRNRVRLGEEKSRLKTNHDRMEGVSEKSVEDSLRRKASSSGSSSSSTSTELCDEEIHPLTDLDSEEGSQSEGGASPRSPRGVDPPPGRGTAPDNAACDRTDLTEIKNLAINLINEIEEEVRRSGRLSEGTREPRKRGEEEKEEKEEGEKEEEEEGRRLPAPAECRKYDNTKNLILDADLQIKRDNILKPEPEVPTCENVIIDARVGVKSPKEEEEERWRNRRKSDLALSVIKENLEMLSKYSQRLEVERKKEKEDVEKKEKEDLERKKEKEDMERKKEKEDMERRKEKEDMERKMEKEDMERKKEKEDMERKKVKEDMERKKEKEDMERKKEEGRKELLLPLPTDTEVQNSSKTEAQDRVRASKNFLVEKAISPMVEKTPKTVKVNKEVNTELTFGVDEVEISTKQASKFDRFEEEMGTSSRKSREAIFREKDEIKQRIETSKSDWELKMRKIAELETTTRETLNEIQARSSHRKSVHRSLDRNTRRACLDLPKSPERHLPKIQLESSTSTEGDSNHRKLRISALSFDEITSRTEKLLARSEFNRSADEPSCRHGLSPEVDSWRGKDATAKYKKLTADTFGEEPETRTSYGFSSSPTSPEYRTRSNVRYPEYLLPKKYGDEGKHEEAVIRVTQTENRTCLEFLDRKYSPERRKPEPEFEFQKANFNPFPTRTVSRPKELGVKLGLYPTSPETQSKKS